MTIRLRLTLWYTGILAITLVLFGSVLYFFLRETYQNNQRVELKNMAQTVYSQMRVRPVITRGGIAYSVTMPQLDDYRYSNLYVQVLQEDGVVAGSSNQPFPYPEGTIEAVKLLPENQVTFQSYTVGNNALLILSQPIIVTMNTDEKVFYGVLQVASVLNSQNQFLETLLSVLILLTVIVILIGATLGLFLARKALKPIDQVIAATERIEKGDDLANRIDYNGPSDEIGRLTQKINSMLARLQGAYSELEESYSAQRRFVSDASHELRTPLTTIRGNVDLLERMWAHTNTELPTLIASGNLEMTREAMQDIAGEAARMSRLINDLLSLARADAGVEMDKDWLSIEPIAQQVVRRATLLPKLVDWQVGDLSALQGSFVYGNEDYLQQLLFIFIENAFKYTDEGFVRIEALRDNDQIGIKIIDTGIGMDKEEVPHIFERFYRADLSRGKKTGTGLGLSIAKWIIDKHGGSIEVKTRLHEGTTFIIWLPASFLPPSD